MKYTKKPVEIEAIQLTKENLFGVVEFIDGNKPVISSSMAGQRWDEYEDLIYTQGFLIIETLEGDMKVSIGDFIIKGVKGVFYPCKPDIFELTYDKV
jgi:hypothetical protein